MRQKCCFNKHIQLTNVDDSRCLQTIEGYNKCEHVFGIWCIQPNTTLSILCECILKYPLTLRIEFMNRLTRSFKKLNRENLQSDIITCDDVLYEVDDCPFEIIDEHKQCIFSCFENCCMHPSSLIPFIVKWIQPNQEKDFIYKLEKELLKHL